MHPERVTPEPPQTAVVADPPAAPTSAQIIGGVSAFLARVLDQLSITSWLPAVFFVGNSAILLTLIGQKEPRLTEAIQELVELRWGAIIVLLFAIVMGAMAIQAFEFESLRFWEGYLRSRLLRIWAKRRIHAHQKKLAKLESEYKRHQHAAFTDARDTALNDSRTTVEQEAMWNILDSALRGRQPTVTASNVPKRSTILGIWNSLLPGRQPIADASDVAGNSIVELDWTKSADPFKLHEMEITELKREEYPDSHRVLPTRLGNVMRAAEDHVKLGPNEDLEGFMIRHMDEMPFTIVAEHAAYRRRLEMYCGLTFVLGFLAAMSVVCLWDAQGIVWRIAVPLTYVVAVWISYRAAVASALGFGQALKEADAWVQKSEAADAE